MSGQKGIKVIPVVKAEWGKKMDPTYKLFSGEEETCGDNEGQAGYYGNLIFRQKNGASRPVGSTLPFSPHLEQQHL